MAIFGGKRRPSGQPTDEEVRRLLLRETFGGEPDWLWHTDAQRRIVDVAPSFAAATRLPIVRLEGRPLLEVLAGSTWEDGNFATGLRQLSEKLKAQKAFRDLRLPVFVAGEERWWEMSGQPRSDDAGRFTGFLGVASDVTEQREAAYRINQLARFDGLTGLPNRIALLEALERFVDDAKHAQRHITVSLLAIANLNDLKVVDGYRQTETLLVGIAEMIAAKLGSAALISHIAPGEFVAVIREADGGARPLHAEGLMMEAARGVMGLTSSGMLASAEVSFPEDGNSGADLIAVGLDRLYSTARLHTRRTEDLQEPADSRSGPLAVAKEKVSHALRRSIVTYGQQASAGLDLLIDEQRTRLHNGPPEALNEAELEQMEVLSTELQNLILLAEEGAEVTRKVTLVATLARQVFRFSQETGELFVAGLKPFLASAPVALGTLMLLQSICTPSVGAVVAPGAALAVLAGHYGLDLRRSKRDD